MMTINELKELIESNQDISAYEIRQSANASYQLFYVSEELETNRSVNTEDLTAVVYTEHEVLRGSSSVVITSADDRDSVTEKLKAAVRKAAQAYNPYYPLAEKTENIHAVSDKACDLSLIARNTADAVFAAEEGTDAKLNATEIFADHNTVRFLNSSGVDHSYDTYSVFCETIPSYDGEKEDVELYYSRYADISDPAEFTETVGTALSNVRYRYDALKLEDVTIPENCLVAVQGDMLRNIMTNFAQELSYSRQYYKMSHTQLNDQISAVPFDMVLKGQEEGICGSSPVDPSGIVLKDTTVIDQGRAAAFWGDQRFGYYLKQEHITGSYPIACVQNYPVISEEDLNRPILYLMSFSAPQLESSSGYFGGEVRLALLVEGDKVTPVTGFSVSGNIYEAVHTAKFSEETASVSARGRMSFKGPKYMYFEQLKLH